MTRKILCSECAEGIRKIVAKFPDEELIEFEGMAKNDFICDDCGKEILAGIHCYAMTIISSNMQQPYRSWESEFIKIKYRL